MPIVAESCDLRDMAKRIIHRSWGTQTRRHPLLAEGGSHRTRHVRIPDDREHRFQSNVNAESAFNFTGIRIWVEQDGKRGLDLYLWLTYRTFSLKRQLRLTWPLLYRQFGVDPAKAGNRRTVDSFRTKCLRELQKIQRAWPDLHYQTVKSGLVLFPSSPRIAPSQLRLVE